MPPKNPPFDPISLRLVPGPVPSLKSLALRGGLLLPLLSGFSSYDLLLRNYTLAIGFSLSWPCLYLLFFFFFLLLYAYLVVTSHLAILEDVGDAPYDLVAPILAQCSASKLATLELASPVSRDFVLVPLSI